MTLDHACSRFLEHCRLAKGLSVHSLRAYAIDLKDFRRVIGGDTEISVIDRDMLDRFLAALRDERGLKASSIKRRFATLKVMFGWLETNDKIADSPFRRFKFPLRQPRRLPRNLAKGELWALAPSLAEGGGKRGQGVHRAAATLGGDFEAQTLTLAILLMVLTGVRVGELCSIRLGDLDLDDASLRIRGKGNRERRVFLIPPAGPDAVRRYLKARERVIRAAGGAVVPHEILLISARGAAADPPLIRRLLRTRAEALDLGRRITPHMLRHTAATRYLERGVDLRYVQRLLGHASISTTEIYAAATDEGLRRAIGGG
jgi:integrase/recombinase XerD